MKLKLYLFLLAFSCQFMSFAQTLDANNSPANSGGGGFTVSPTQNVGQSFLAGLTGPLSQVNVYFLNFSFTAGDFRLTIYNGDGYGGTVVGTQNFTLASAPTDGEYIIPISSTISITAGNMYTMRLDGITGSGNFIAPSGNIYSNGLLYFSNGSSFSSYDLWFKTFITLPTPATHLNFDGVDDYVALSNESNFDFTDQMTVEFWMNSSVTNPEQWDALVVKGDDSWRVHLNATGTVYFTCSSGASTLNAISTTVVTDGNWHHIAATLGGNNAKIYIDGVLEDQVALPGILNNSTYPVLIGNNPVFGPRYYTGNLDDVRIWNIARTTEQINGSKNCELQGTETGLVAYYKFNQGINAADNSAITTLTDATANANNGTLTNFTLNGSTSNFLAGSPVTTGSIVPSNATVTTPVVYNQGATASALTATTGTNGTGLMWYTVATGGTGSTAPAPSTATAGNTSYWVSSTNANGCESARTEIVVTVNAAATHLNFGAVNDYVNCGNDPSLQITGTAITLEAYVKFNSFGAAPFLGNIINKDEVAIASGYMLRAGGNGVVNFVVANNGWNEIYSPDNSVSLNTWHHIAGVYDGVNSKIYVDGVEVVSQPLSITIGNANVNLNIGKDSSYSDRFIDASIDDVRIWNRALPIAEIQNNMNCELPSPTTQNGLIAYYQFNQGFNAATNSAITTLTDASASGNNGTLTNFALTGTTSNWLAGSTIVTGTNCAVLSSSSFDVTSNINVYPNPTNGNVNIMVNNLTNVSVSVYDLNGRTILNKELSANENAVDISNFQSGMYLFKIKSSEGETVKKVIKY